VSDILPPQQHALFHYCRLIEDFGVPGGLCSSITESRHITTIKKPWHQSNRYNSLGQMLRTNQCLDKLTAMHCNFVLHGMLPGGHASGRTLSHVLPRSVGGNGAESDDEGPADEDVILGGVVLARTCGITKHLFWMLDSDT